MKFIELKLKDFSKTPFGRFPEDGNFNGQTYREEILIPALENNDVVTLILDVEYGLGSSFLEEVFGGLLRSGYSPEDLKSRLNIVPDHSLYIDEIYNFIKWN